MLGPGSDDSHANNIHLDFLGPGLRLGFHAVHHHVLDRVWALRAAEGRDAPRGVLRPPLHQPVNRHIEPRYPIEHGGDLPGSESRERSAEGAHHRAGRRVLEVEAQMTDPIPESVRGGEVTLRPSALALLHERHHVSWDLNHPRVSG